MEKCGKPCSISRPFLFKTEKCVRFESQLVQLSCRGKEHEGRVLAVYPADCEFGEKNSTGLDKAEHEVALTSEDESPNVMNTFLIRRGSGFRGGCTAGEATTSRSNADEFEVVCFGDRVIFSANPELFDEENAVKFKDLVCSTVSKGFNEFLYGGRRRRDAFSRKVFTVFRESTFARENEFEIVPHINRLISSVGDEVQERGRVVKTSDVFFLRHCGRGGFLRAREENWPTLDFGVVTPVVSDENDAMLCRRQRFDKSFVWKFLLHTS